VPQKQGPCIALALSPADNKRTAADDPPLSTLEERTMLRAIFRTVGVFGTIFAAGYVAQRYFGWDARGLMDQAKDKLNDMSGSHGSSSTDTLKAPLRDTAERHAI